jgi:WD40 repeat protein
MSRSLQDLTILASLLVLLLLPQVRADDPDWPAPEPTAPKLEYRILRVIKEDSPFVFALSADGKILLNYHAIAGRLWDVRTGKQIAHFESDDPYPITSAAISADGRTVAFASGMESSISLYDVGLGKVVRTLPGRRSYVNRLTFSPDGKLLASLVDKEPIKLWDVGTGKNLQCFNPKSFTGDNSTEFVFARDGKTLAVATRDGIVHLLNVTKGEEVRQIAPGRGIEPAALAFSPDGDLLAVGLSRRNSIAVWDTRTGKLVREHTWARDKFRFIQKDGTPNEEFRLPGVTSGVTMAFTPDGRALMAACCDMRIRVWETASGGLRYRAEEEISHSENQLYGIVIARNRWLWASDFRDKKSINLWDARPSLPSCRPGLPLDADKSWSGLAGADAGAAYTLMRELMTSPRESVAILDKRLPTLPRIEAAVVQALVHDLDHDSFDVREQASHRLAELDEAARPAQVDALG